MRGVDNGGDLLSRVHEWRRGHGICRTHSEDLFGAAGLGHDLNRSGSELDAEAETVRTLDLLDWRRGCETLN